MADLLVFSADPDRLLIESATRVGIAVKSYISNPWIGWTSGKLKDGIAFLSQQSEPYALWVDGHDSLILKPEDEIMRFVPESGVLVAAEKNCWPDNAIAGKYDLVNRSQRRLDDPQYLNAGGYCGRRDELIRTMRFVLELANGDENDQAAWAQAFLAGTEITIDHQRHIFCSEGDGGTANADPCVRHWNGKIPGREDFFRSL